MTKNQKAEISELKNINNWKWRKENSIAWALSKNQSIEQIYVCPGNGGTSNFEKCICLKPKSEDEKTIIMNVKRLEINLVIIGPEVPLAKGLANAMRNAGLTVFGPGKEGAQLEASKDWAKALMIENNIPTANYWSADSKEEGLEILKNQTNLLLIKADGLAAGKGVTVCATPLRNRRDAIKDVFSESLVLQGIKSFSKKKMKGQKFLFLLFVMEKN